MRVREYYWYDTEDGEDILKKTNFAAKWALIGAFPYAYFDQMVNPQKTFAGYGFRFLACTIPALGMAGMFTITSQMLIKHVPQIHPTVSYAIGGMAAGSVIGAYTKSVRIGSTAGVYLAVVAALTRAVHAGHPYNPWGDLPLLVNNDDPDLSKEYFPGKPLNLPPPIARPAYGPTIIN